MTPVDMKPVTAGGAPSYASGVHMWNGTADTLNAKPTSSSPIATRCRAFGAIDCAANSDATRSIFVLPVNP
ncbi:MAG: hypothetical protein QM736_02215 [Vicinamibacterales bacterium]